MDPWINLQLQEPTSARHADVARSANCPRTIENDPLADAEVIVAYRESYSYFTTRRYDPSPVQIAYRGKTPRSTPVPWVSSELCLVYVIIMLFLNCSLYSN
jgi:hypothetical protein